MSRDTGDKRPGDKGTGHRPPLGGRVSPVHPLERKKQPKPTGPTACYRFPNRPAFRKCGNCGCTPDTIHMPFGLAGRWCGVCCPACHPPKRVPPAQGELLEVTA